MVPVERLLHVCQKHANRPALTFADETTTYGQLREQVMAMAQRLAAKVPAGGRLALLCSNSLDFVVLSLAAEAAGIIRVPLNIKATPAEIGTMTADCQPALIVYEAPMAPLLEQAGAFPALQVDELARNIQTSTPVDALTRGIETSTPLDELARSTDTATGVVAQPTDRCSITYTSGSTGKPKGVVLTHANWHYVYMNMLIDRDIAHDDVLAVIGPLTHASWTYLYAVLLRGGQAVIFPAGDVDAMLDYAAHRSITLITCVPTVVSRILNRMPEGHLLCSTLKWIGVGGAPMGPALLERAMQVFGPRLVLNYGQTEAMMTCSFYDLRHEPGRDDVAAYIGRPYVFTEMFIVGADGNRAALGEVGELCIRGPHTMLEYWGAPELTADTVREGAVWTGDLAVEVEPGLFKMVGRAKEIIISGGFNIYPLEVESAVSALPGVDEVAVIGLPCEEWGETVICFFSTLDGTPYNTQDMRAALRPQLGIKTPKAFHQLAALPKAATGKIDKKALRAQMEQPS